jgi:hypothetical protein
MAVLSVLLMPRFRFHLSKPQLIQNGYGEKASATDAIEKR